MGEGMGMAEQMTTTYEAPFMGVDDLPRHLRTCAAMSADVELILPARVALQLARRIEAAAPRPEDTPLAWIDSRLARAERVAVWLTCATGLAAAVLVALAVAA